MASQFLRRYTDITSLIHVLRTRKLTLIDPASWDDSNDSHYVTLYKEKKSLGTTLALCFTQTDERYHYWRVFATGSSGVCIQFERAPFLKAVQKQSGIEARSVRYVTLNELRTMNLEVDDLPFLKRFAFGDEDEFRLFYASEAKNAKQEVTIPLSCISKITLSPWLHPDLSGDVKACLREIKGCEKLSIVRSTLIGNEEWKEYGEAAN